MSKYLLKKGAMKRLIYILTILIISSSCVTTREAKLSRIEKRNERKLAEKEVVKQAVESKRYIIKFDRLYFTHGGMVELIPQTNYMIIDGDRAIISAAYFGRQYDIRPIAGINMRGETRNYEVSDDQNKGIYKINMDVNNQSTSFDVNLTVGESGRCTATISSLKIDFVRYSGHIVPIRNGKAQPAEEDDIQELPVISI